MTCAFTRGNWPKESGKSWQITAFKWSFSNGENDKPITWANDGCVLWLIVSCWPVAEWVSKFQFASASSSLMLLNWINLCWSYLTSVGKIVRYIQRSCRSLIVHINIWEQFGRSIKCSFFSKITWRSSAKLAECSKWCPLEHVQHAQTRQRGVLSSWPSEQHWYFLLLCYSLSNQFAW